MKKKNQTTAVWYFLIIHWTKKQIEIFYSLNVQLIEEKMHNLEYDESIQPIDGNNMPSAQIYKMPFAGSKRGPTQANIKRHFHLQLPHIKGVKIVFTKLD